MEYLFPGGDKSLQLVRTGKRRKGGSPSFAIPQATKKLLHWVPAAFYMVFIFILSSQPNLLLPYPFAEADKVYHIAAYALLGILITYALVGSGITTNVVLLASLLALLYGLADEFHQSFIPGRNLSAFDMLADGVGALIGSYLYNWARLLTAGLRGPNGSSIWFTCFKRGRSPL